MALAPRDAVAALGTYGRADGIWETSWATPRGKVTTLEYLPFDRKQDGMGAGPSLLQRTWGLLDASVDRICHLDKTTSEYQTERIRARAIAEVLALFMPPHFTTADEIAREAMRRYMARVNNDSTYETAGLGSRKYEPPPGSPVRSARETTPVKKAAPKSKPSKAIPEGQVNSARQGISTGMFTVGMIAKMYGMTEAEVTKQLGLP